MDEAHRAIACWQDLARAECVVEEMTSPLERMQKHAAWDRRVRIVLKEVLLCPVVDGWVLEEIQALSEET